MQIRNGKYIVWGLFPREPQGPRRNQEGKENSDQDFHPTLSYQNWTRMERMIWDYSGIRGKVLRERKREGETDPQHANRNFFHVLCMNRNRGLQSEIILPSRPVGVCLVYIPCGFLGLFSLLVGNRNSLLFCFDTTRELSFLLCMHGTWGPKVKWPT